MRTRGRRTPLWRITQYGREIERGEHHDTLRLYLVLRLSMRGLEHELVR